LTIKPTPIPPTIPLIGTPASIKAKVEAEADAIEELPLDDKVSETNITVYGKSFCEGITGLNAFSANIPCPMSRDLGDPIFPTSPEAKGGKL